MHHIHWVICPYKNLHTEVLFCSERLISEYQKENTDKLEVCDLYALVGKGGPH